MSLLTPLKAPSLPNARRLMQLGVVEALVTPHGLDRYLELIHPMLTVRELRAAVTDVEHTTADSITLTLRPTRQWNGFEAGQFVQVAVDIDGVRHTRCYSPACSQYRADGRLEITVKAHPDGIVSQYLKCHGQPGLVVGLSQAEGSFRLPSPRPQRVLLISGGSGITPVLSMLRTLCDEGFSGEIVFLHYAFTQDDVACLAQLREIAAAHDNVRLVLAYTQQQAGGDLHGMFGETHLADSAPWYAEAQTYLCGPPGLMAAIREHYSAKGIQDTLHSEEFVLASAVVISDDDVAGAVGFSKSGSSVENSGATLLEQAEAAGLRPEFGCRMGICFSCTQVKQSGCTRDIRNGELNTDPDVQVQLCINVPVGDVVIDI